MKKLIKMIAVIFLTFNVSGCAEYLVAEAVLATAQAISESSKNSSSYSSSSSSYVSKNYKPIMSRESNNRVCAVASNEYISSHLRTQYLEESRRRGLDCGENKSKNTIKDIEINGIKLRLQKVEGLPPKELRKLVDKGKKELSDGVVVVFTTKDDKVGIAVGVTENLTDKFDAVKFVKVGSQIIGGQGGGGRKDFAQAGGQDQSKIDKAFEKIKKLI